MIKYKISFSTNYWRHTSEIRIHPFSPHADSATAPPTSHPVHLTRVLFQKLTDTEISDADWTSFIKSNSIIGFVDDAREFSFLSNRTMIVPTQVGIDCEIKVKVEQTRNEGWHVALYFNTIGAEKLIIPILDMLHKQGVVYNAQLAMELLRCFGFGKESNLLGICSHVQDIIGALQADDVLSKEMLYINFTLLRALEGNQKYVEYCLYAVDLLIKKKFGRCALLIISNIQDGKVAQECADFLASLRDKPETQYNPQWYKRIIAAMRFETSWIRNYLSVKETNTPKLFNSFTAFSNNIQDYINRQAKTYLIQIFYDKHKGLRIVFDVKKLQSEQYTQFIPIIAAKLQEYGIILDIWQLNTFLNGLLNYKDSETIIKHGRLVLDDLEEDDPFSQQINYINCKLLPWLMRQDFSPELFQEVSCCVIDKLIEKQFLKCATFMLGNIWYCGNLNTYKARIQEEIGSAKLADITLDKYPRMQAALECFLSSPQPEDSRNAALLREYAGLEFDSRLVDEHGEIDLAEYKDPKVFMRVLTLLRDGTKANGSAEWDTSAKSRTIFKQTKGLKHQ